MTIFKHDIKNRNYHKKYFVTKILSKVQLGSSKMSKDG